MIRRSIPARAVPRLATALAIASAALPGTGSAETVTTAARVGLASGWIVRGMLLSEQDSPVALAGIDAYGSSGWSVGLAGSRMRTSTSEWATGWTLRAAYEHTLDEQWTLLGELRHTSYQGSDSLQPWCYNQASLGVGYSDRWALTWNGETRRGPGCHGGGPTLSGRTLDLTTRWPLGHGFGGDAGIGRFFQGRIVGDGYAVSTGYSYAQAGVTWREGAFQAQLGRLWVQDHARALYGPMAANRWVAGVGWSF